MRALQVSAGCGTEGISFTLYADMNPTFDRSWIRAEFENNRIYIEAIGSLPIAFQSIVVALNEGESLWMEPYLGCSPPFALEGGTVRVVAQVGPNPVLKYYGDAANPFRPFMLRQGHRIVLHVVSAARPSPYPVYPGPLKGDPNAIIAGEALDVRSDRLADGSLTPAVLPPFDLPPTRPLLDFWRVGAGSADYTLDDWVLTRFGNPSRIAVLGLHQFGRVPWADVDCNHHYDLIGCCLASFLRFGDPASWLAASVLAWRHLQTGVRMNGTGAGRSTGGLHEYEKTLAQPGADSYTGSGNEPIETHAWDAGLAAFAFLSGDQLAHDWAMMRADWLASQPPTSTWLWQGAGGSRWIGWYARNCRAMMTLGYWPTGPAARKTFVEAYVDHVLALKTKAGTAWLPNAYTPNGFKPWMDAIAYTELIRLMDHVGISNSSARYLAVMSGAEWLIQNAVDQNGVAPYEVIDRNDRTKDNRSYPAEISGWHLPLTTMLARRGYLGADSALAAAVRSTVLGGLTVSAAGAVSMGPAAVKAWAGAMWALQGADVLSAP